MKPVLFIAVICIGFSFCNSTNTFTAPNYIYKNSGIELQLKYINRSKDSIDFLLTIDSIEMKKFRGVATLILIEDAFGTMIIPEGTGAIDYNNPNNKMGYKCDSAYSYESKDGTLRISFAMENSIKRFEFEEETKHRLDFHLSRYNKSGTKTELDISKTLLLDAN